ncbi:MAG TPA: arsenosugar biosynthesis radical SAM (seleno)protein ArsS [Myxococcota bacterium]|nr:arsenosugar biosynthesis radical SAM (seleno)protein ArsS [Myxococcota bacterium]
MSLPNFAAALAEHALPELRREAVTTLQVNVGKRCDLACHHCHVEAGPKRTEAMDAPTAARVIDLLAANPGIGTLDLTGGAPELNANFRDLVRAARALGREVIDRCNLTILFEPEQEDTAEFLAEQRVSVVASLPCYTRENVDAQRGKRVFERSVAALQRLNALGYAQPGSGRSLDLVYNPLGPSLPPDQSQLEATYRARLREDFGIDFDHLATITNMPIKRFAHALERDGKSEQYMSLLVNHFNPKTVPGLMCRSLVSVGWDGALYDCDFNQMLELPLGAHGPHTIWEIDDLAELAGARIATDAHCFGCTAGAGSSCGGALA